MKKIKLLSCIAFIIVLMSCERKYRWGPSECAPQHYPAKILTNNFQYKNGGGVGTLQVTAGGNGWGYTGASYAVGERLKPVPDSLFVNWFSITEGKFYKGKFKLTSKKIEEALKKGQIRVYTCFAPHGRVVVYVAGKHGRAPIDRFRAIEDTSMTIAKHILKINGVKTEQEFEEKYGEKLDGSTYLKHYIKKEDSIYISKHGIPDTW
ncbi:hypothetical protein A8C32_11985 [Flavivirga aquatica]|uniref:DUF2931 domain-containing protein n=1 Tax=Flavivirga aquatica TaxID=1849968 RepID=A0A1E5TDK1_9FLAO|nr:DUF2931 family protein [Flavivirga aquatica]OEK09431.1 hypothetical protein A8C32_11985 [Flavivirga aquatica]